MLTLPTRKRRKKQPYLAIRSRLTRRQIAKQAGLFFPELRQFMQERGIETAGGPFIRYNVVGPHELDLEFGHFTERLYPGSGPIRAGTVPAGTYVSVTWHGHFDKLQEVDAMLIGWARETGAPLDCTETQAGLFFGCRMAIYHNALQHPTDPDQWQTEVAIMLRQPQGA
jgi:effector-binding domain-containing protein